jgi:hypothetical protein
MLTSNYHHRDLGTEVVDIIVGPKRKRFVVHEQLLTSRSTYFRDILRGSNIGNKSKVYFDDDDPAAVALFVGWLYRGTIPGVAEMEMKIQTPVSSNSSVPSGSTSNGRNVPLELPYTMDGQVGLKPPAPLKQLSAIKPLSQSRHSTSLPQVIKSEPGISSSGQVTPRAPSGHSALFSDVTSSISSESSSLTTFDHKFRYQQLRFLCLHGQAVLRPLAS